MAFRYIHIKGSKDARRIVIKQKGYGKNWSKQRNAALERDNYQCQKCGRKGKKKGYYWDLHIHHISKIKNFVNLQTKEVDYEKANDLSNLITLCPQCHKYADGHDGNRSGFIRL